MVIIKGLESIFQQLINKHVNHKPKSIVMMVTLNPNLAPHWPQTNCILRSFSLRSPVAQRVKRPPLETLLAKCAHQLPCACDIPR